MRSDEPEVVAEVRAAFEAYERALLANDVAAMDGAFWDDPRVVRFGIAEIQHGFAEVAEWRSTATPVPTDRHHERVTITAFGRDLAVTSLVFRNGDASATGRQSQVWARLAGGWASRARPRVCPGIAPPPQSVAPMSCNRIASKVIL